MPTTVTLTPNGIVPGSTIYPTTGGAMHVVLADASDATYVISPWGRAVAVLGMSTFTIPAKARVSSAQITLRARWYSAVSGIAMAILREGITGTGNLFGTLITAAFANYAGATQPFTPQGRVWDQTELDLLTLYFEQLYPTSFIEVARATVDVTYVDAPTVSVVAPTTTQVTTRPIIGWVYAHTDGLPQAGYYVKIFEAAQYNAPGWSVNDPTPYAHTQAGIDAIWAPSNDLENGKTYRAYVRVSTTVNGRPVYSDGAPWDTGVAPENWDFVEFDIELDAASAPELLVTASGAAGRNRLDLVGTANQLSKQNASFEATGVGGWVTFASATLARVTSAGNFSHGAAAMSITSTAGSNTLTAQLVDLIAVRAGRRYTATAAFKRGATSRNCRVTVAWYNAANVLISTSSGTTVTDDGAGPLLNGFRSAHVSDVAPAGAVVALLGLEVGSANVANAEIHYVDQISFAAGSSTVWSRGGLSNRNLLTADQSSFESGTAAGYTAHTNSAVSNTASGTPPHGTRALAVASLAAGLTAARSPAGANASPVFPGATYTALASFKKASGASVFAGVWINWYDAGGVLRYASDAGATLATTGAWSQALITAEAPTFFDVAYAGPSVYFGATAALESVWVDKVSLSLSDSAVWQLGETIADKTMVVEYSDDDGVTWLPVRDTPALDSSLSAVLYDYEAPSTLREYRARELDVESGFNLASPWSTVQGARLFHAAWWLKPIGHPDANIRLRVVPPIRDTRPETQGRFTPLGSSRDTVVRARPRGRVWAVEAQFFGDEDYAAFEAVRDLRVPCVFADDQGGSWYVEIGDTVETSLLQTVSRQTAPYRRVTFALTETNRPA